MNSIIFLFISTILISKNLKGACGSGWTDKIVPDSIFGSDFTNCCVLHDECYDKCRPKTDCDHEFWECTKDVCRPKSYIKKRICFGASELYYNAVRDFGGGAYSSVCPKFYLFENGTSTENKTLIVQKLKKQIEELKKNEEEMKKL
jgi:hypothetical protein